MQTIRSTEQSVIEKLYYVNQNYIVQDSFEHKGIILKVRNGGGSIEEMNRILEICGMKIISKEKNKCYRLEVN